MEVKERSLAEIIKLIIVTIKQCGCYLGRLYSHYQAEKKYYSKLLNPSES